MTDEQLSEIMLRTVNCKVPTNLLIVLCAGVAELQRAIEVEPERVRADYGRRLAKHIAATGSPRDRGAASGGS